jgi:hypothetical protein
MASINAPVSISDVVAQAGNYTYNAQIPLANWLRTASTMQKEVRRPTRCIHVPELTFSRRKSTMQKEMTHKRTSCYTDTPTLFSRSCRPIRTGTSRRTAKR